ncbi:MULTISPECIES: TRAP transporter small permease subunit [unclassified Beijerinckia]|uniref:TRAP transporter small permease n=1 Tax=unclassified Beijerinckia TaxID=2638183 RepID=UPI0008990ADB|nr:MULTISPECIES: TRAP transporter small permease subunit [unclassified Beijerinckia]MDH7798811.1 TRAP-type C4-dicarboxylate transport system permease small subunit [Beijerinckia sp. GAS462]SED34065.1 TRAP-type C4-dicarboxylate transport system, small permease component [Beijerinckia sp. 28-YEA-48]
MRVLFWLNGWLVRILCILAVAAIAAMTLGISAEVILRMFGFPSIVGLIELTEYGLFISTFFAAPHLLRTNEHIRVDIVMSRIEPATARTLEFFALGCVIAVSIVTGAIATAIMISNAQLGTLIFKDLIFPQWWLDWIIPLTSLALAVQALELMVMLKTSTLAVSTEASEHIPGLRAEEMP